MPVTGVAENSQIEISSFIVVCYIQDNTDEQGIRMLIQHLVSPPGSLFKLYRNQKRTHLSNHLVCRITVDVGHAIWHFSHLSYDDVDSLCFISPVCMDEGTRPIPGSQIP